MLRWLRRILIALTSLVVAAIAFCYFAVRGSLPQLDGTVIAPTLSAPVTIARDAQGVVTITADNRVDLAYATGYAHGQDRFFQMDLQRRAAAGELSELLGADALSLDKRFRRHNFRAVARRVIEQATPEQKKIVDAYVAGVNAALAAMKVRPFEYLLLGLHPQPWRAEDCVLVAFTMYIDLNDSDGADELERARLHAALPQSVYDVLYPRGTQWDATLDGIDLSALPAPLPGPDAIDVHSHAPARDAHSDSAPPGDADYPGSNNWAVAGSRTANGGAIVANDMHLALRLPHIWYRARLIVRASNDASEAQSKDDAPRDLTGVTLPGLPLLVAGSNRHVAWGYTNSQGDYDDLVIVDTDAAHPNQYRNGDRYLDFKVRHERIDVRGQAPVEVDYRDTIWGPLLDATLDGKPLALAWTAQHPRATNLNQLDLETAQDVERALDIADTAGIPVQNFMVADSQGHIGWTLIGQLPRRETYDGQLPTCWGCATDAGWQGWLAPHDHPRIVDPPGGQLWSANSRTLGAAQAQLIGDEGMDRGARARQIRDDLRSAQQATPRDMLKIQLDDRALFLDRWRDLLLNLRDETYLRGHPARRTALDLVAAGARAADVNDAGYRIVRAFRGEVQKDIYDELVASARTRYPDAKFKPSARFENTAWRIMTTQPANLLDPKYDNWTARILADFDGAIARLERQCDVDWERLSECTWGKRNTLSMEHPLASALPVLGVWLRMPRTQLPGDHDMPRVQDVSFGASERFAVSPGHEDEGYFHMPGGQSGNPLSPYFSAGHEAWVKGEPTPFLPGPAQHTLTLRGR